MAQSLVDGLLELYTAIGIGVVVGTVLNRVRREQKLNEKALKINTVLVLNIATPALILVSLLTAEISLNVELVLAIIGVQVSTAIIGVIFAIVIMTRRKLPREQIGGYVLISGWPNATIFPLPIVISVFGDSFITIVMLFSSSALALRGTLATYLCVKFGAVKNQKISIKRTLREIFTFPPTISIIIAFVILAFSIPLPAVVLDVLVITKPWFSTLANVYGAITVGMILASVDRTQFLTYKKEIPWAMLLRFVVPALSYLPLSLFLAFPQDSATIKSILLLEVLGPPAIINTMFAANFHLDKNLVAVMVVVLTLFMILLAPLILLAGSCMF